MPTEAITKTGVLIADSSPHMAGMITQMLRSLGRKDMREAYDATRAMQELNRRAYEVLVIDSDLEGLDGVAFTRKLRAATDCQNRSIPIIMMSAAPDARRIADARDAGITEFLRKPFAANHLQTRLDSIEAHPRSFIEAPQFKGPDRRRKTIDVGTRNRRSDAGTEPTIP